MVDETQGETPPPKATGEQSPWALAGLGAQFFVALLAFVYAGSWADTKLGTSPLFILAGVFLGGGGTFYLSYKRLMREAVSASTQSPSRSDGSQSK